MTLSLEQRVSSAKTILAQSSTPSQSAKAAKQIVGTFAHVRADNPETFIASVAAVLSQYPLGVIEDCADPRIGIARKVEFLSVKSLVEWCDARLAFYQGLAAYVAPPSKRIERKMTDEDLRKGSAAMRGLHRALVEKRDISALSFEDCVDLGTSEAAE